MNTALFTFQRRVDVNGQVILNDNFINPQNVISFYWQQNEAGKSVLSVFVANNYTFTFGESVGQKFVQHMEDFLALSLNRNTVPQSREVNKPLHRDGPRPARRAIEAEIIEEIPQEPTAQWSGN